LPAFTFPSHANNIDFSNIRQFCRLNQKNVPFRLFYFIKLIELCSFEEINGHGPIFEDLREHGKL